MVISLSVPEGAKAVGIHSAPLKYSHIPVVVKVPDAEDLKGDPSEEE